LLGRRGANSSSVHVVVQAEVFAVLELDEKSAEAASQPLAVLNAKGDGALAPVAAEGDQSAVPEMTPDRVYVRQLSVRETEWRDGISTKTDQAGLAKDTFTGAADEGVSVYEVAGDLEEAAVGAVLQLLRSGTKSAYLLRLSSSRLRQSGIRISDEELGTTGVLLVDQKHRDLLGPPEAYAQLTQLLIEEILHGGDSIREVRTTQQRYQLGRLLEDDAIPSRHRQRAELAISAGARKGAT
jgi:hypothetical protein